MESIARAAEQLFLPEVGIYILSLCVLCFLCGEIFFKRRVLHADHEPKLRDIPGKRGYNPFPVRLHRLIGLNLVVSITNNNVNPPTTTILSPSQYTVTGIGLETGGNITYPISGNPLPTGWSLTIQRIVPYQQNTSLTNQGAFYPQVVEACLDNLTMQTQQLAAQIAGVPIPALQVAETQPENDNSNAVATDAFVQNQFISGGMGWASLMYPGYGADPTGVHDSTAALNAAIASGYDVFVPPGKYLISGQIAMPTTGPPRKNQGR